MFWITRSLTVTLALSRAHVSSKLPSGNLVRCAVLSRRSRPKLPGSLISSTVRPSKVTAVIFAPGVPWALGQTKLDHCGGVLR